MVWRVANICTRRVFKLGKDRGFFVWQKTANLCKLSRIEAVAKQEQAWDKLLERVQLQISTVRRFHLSAEMWQLDILSPFWRLYVNDRAGAYIIFEGERIDIAPDRLYLIPAWVRFQTGTSQELNQNFIHFYLTGFSPTLLRQLFFRPYSLALEAPLAALAQQWQSSLDIEVTPGLAEFSWSYALVHTAMAQCVTELLEEKNRRGDYWLRESSLVWPAIECIETRLADPPTNAELAALCHLSTDHFIRHFRHSIGLTPAQYGLERRIAAAAYRLINSKQSIEEIAAATGFTDRFHFSKAFRQRLHIPPVAYRKMHWQGS
ncbi:AraC family transcriptional regulator [bacterium]|nr:MAG: AraC family transcriptional regulator [bacterium]